MIGTIVSAPIFLGVLPADTLVKGRGHRYRKNETGTWDCITDPSCPRLTADEMPHSVVILTVPASAWKCGCTDHACTSWGCGGCHKQTKRPRKRHTTVSDAERNRCAA